MNCDSCKSSDCTASVRKENETESEFQDRCRLQSKLCRIRHKIIVLSGKGGVGKSTVAVNLAAALVLEGKKVGLLDADIHGPSVPTMLGLEHQQVLQTDDELLPVDTDGLKVMSLGFLLQSQNDAVIWRGPMKATVLKQFLQDVQWGDLDYLIIDSPPGTGDEPLSICQMTGPGTYAVIVTTPQKVAAVDVRKSITFCGQLHIPILGIVENMSGFACPKCGEVTHILPAGISMEMAEEMRVRFLGAIPIDPKIALACDNGQAFIRHFASTGTAMIMRDIVQPILELDADRINEIVN
ncbi:MAG: Mrp/NBP35 family ATP-binding protein [Candidatus Wallbacteria bacterium]|nr:Mrp/NBP35 family ATP-binding protein [Candidatus Wallbacteria bacterium]